MAHDNDYFEKDYDDHVYEDDYYEENYEGEELADDEEDDYDEEYDDEDEGEPESKRVHLIYACEDCDYRWDDYVVGFVGSVEETESFGDVACPMCGSVNVEQI